MGYGLWAMGCGPCCMDSRPLLILTLSTAKGKDLARLSPSVVAIFLGRVSRSLAVLGMRTLASLARMGQPIANSQ